MKILALDPASRTGWAWTDGTNRDSGTWDLGSGPHGQRLNRLRGLIVGIHRMHGIDRIAFEEASMGASGRFGKGPQWSTIVFHNKLRGAVEIAADSLGCELMPYNITAIKAYATGSGRADKTQMMAACKRLLGIEPRDDNEADALWILDMAKANYQPPPSEKKRKKAEKKFYGKQPKLFR